VPALDHRVRRQHAALGTKITLRHQQQVWISDGTNARILKYDRNGRLLYWWGVYGTSPGTFWEMLQFSVDTDGNLYAADSFGGRTQTLRPKAELGGGIEIRLIIPRHDDDPSRRRRRFRPLRRDARLVARGWRADTNAAVGAGHAQAAGLQA
jgi:hypothetical protein